MPARSFKNWRNVTSLGTGRPGIEPVVLLGVLIFQFLERVPDRQAAELGVRSSFKDQDCGYVFILNDEMSSSASRSRYAS